MQWDVFISHASEDKEPFVRELASSLRSAGLNVWYDEFSLALGDSLNRSIDHGLSASRFGIVVLSRSFFRKEWPRKELDGLVARESSGDKVILPLWHDLDHSEVAKYSPTLADRVAVRTSEGLAHVVEKVLEALGRSQNREPDRTGVASPENRRRELAAALRDRDTPQPLDDSFLDLYEELFEQTFLAGRLHDAYDLYTGLAVTYGFDLSDRGELSRGLRMVSRFSEVGSPTEIRPEVDGERRALLLSDWAAYARRLGDLETAAVAQRRALRISASPRGEWVCLFNLATIDLHRAALHAAEDLAVSAWNRAHDLSWPNGMASCSALLGYLRHLQGRGEEADQAFEDARTEDPDYCAGVGAFWSALRSRDLGETTEAGEVFDRLRRQSPPDRSHALYTALRGQLAVADDPDAAGRCLREARAWSERTGDVEVELEADLLATRLGCLKSDLAGARETATRGSRRAGETSFDLRRVDFLVELARIALLAGEHERSLEHAEAAIRRAFEPGCGYIVGATAAWLVAGTASARLGRKSEARRRFEQCLDARRRLGVLDFEDVHAEMRTL